MSHSHTPTPQSEAELRAYMQSEIEWLKRSNAELLNIVQTVLSYTIMENQNPFRMVLGLTLLNERMKTAIANAHQKRS